VTICWAKNWDHRSWQSQAEVRDNQIEGAVSAALRILMHNST
jgi:hypothetical protein